jgi:radical SAM protein with 4Fe4S-binding SPASM domain
LEIRPNYSRKEIEKIAKNIGSVNPKVVVISGGEPLLDNDLAIFFDEARKIATEELWICTNGTLISDESIKLFKKVGVNGVSLSLRHPDSDKESKISRNKEVYNKVLSAIDKIKNTGIRVALEMTITKLNYTSVNDFIQLGIDKKVDLIMFKRFRPIGRGKEYDKLTLSKEKNKQILHTIFLRALKEINANIKVDDPLYSLEIYKYSEKHSDKSNVPKYMTKFSSVQSSIIPELNFCSSSNIAESGSQRYWGCKAGTEWVGIDPLGNVSPCPLLSYAGLNIGNVNKQTLSSIMEKSPIIKELRNGCEKGKCSNSGICGGCRSHAAATSGNYLAKDPMCLECATGECF